MRARRLIVGALLSFTAIAAAALAPETIEADAADRAAFARLAAKAEAQDYAALPFDERVQRLAADAALQGRDYAKSPLDRDPAHERVYAGFLRFDCVTFVESVLALSDSLAQRRPAFDDYAAQLAALRYRHGEPAYCERLHYFSDWVRSNVAAGRLDEVTDLVAGEAANLAFAAEPQGLNYLSRNAASNPALAQDAARQACIARSEEAVTAAFARAPDGTPGFAYIPKARLAAVESRLRGGDLVAWVADQPGLDVIHVGIILRRSADAPPGFAHASLRAGDTTVAPDLLAYARTLPRQRGLIVLRPKAPPLR
ncbi:MAG: hypothetical protein NVS9B10_22450 [Nevskia sp.]